MQHYMIITDTNECKIENYLLDFISTQIEINIGKKVPFRELSSETAYEWDLSQTNLSKQLKDLIQNTILNKNVDCNFVSTKNQRRKKLLLADMDSTIIS